jgi:chemotaxis signal transduction protein
MTIGGRNCALPLQAVIGIAECGPVMPLPFAGDAVDGLVTLFGRPVVQLDPARLFDGIGPADGMLVLVQAPHGRIALKVGRATGITEPGTPAISDPGAAGPDGPFTGTVRHGGLDHAILDITELDPERSAPHLERPADAAPGSHHDSPVRNPPPPVPLLFAEFAGTTVAMLPEAIEKVVKIASLHPVPQAPSWLRGITLCHGEAIPVLSLVRLAGEQAADGTGADMLVVLRLTLGRIGIAVQRVIGMRAIPAADFRPFHTPRSGAHGLVVTAASGMIDVIAPVQLVTAIEDELAGWMTTVGSAEPGRR